MLEYTNDIMSGGVREGSGLTGSQKNFRDKQINLIYLFDSVCKVHGLHCYMMYETLLGAVSRHGFIANEESVSLAMMRPDYEKMKSIMATQFPRGAMTSLLTAYTKPCVSEAYAKFVDMRTATYEGDRFEPKGVWIDIYPLDAVQDGTPDAKKIWDGEIWLMMSIGFQNQYGNAAHGHSSPFSQDVMSKYQNMKPAERLKKYEEFALKSFEHSTRVNYFFNEMAALNAQKMDADVMQRMKNPVKGSMLKSWFDVPSELRFETMKFPAPKFHDEVLMATYGDWSLAVQRLAAPSERPPALDSYSEHGEDNIVTINVTPDSTTTIEQDADFAPAPRDVTGDVMTIDAEIIEPSSNSPSSYTPQPEPPKKSTFKIPDFGSDEPKIFSMLRNMEEPKPRPKKTSLLNHEELQSNISDEKGVLTDAQRKILEALHFSIASMPAAQKAPKTEPADEKKSPDEASDEKINEHDTINTDENKKEHDMNKDEEQNNKDVPAGGKPDDTQKAEPPAEQNAESEEQPSPESDQEHEPVPALTLTPEPMPEPQKSYTPRHAKIDDPQSDAAKQNETSHPQKDEMKTELNFEPEPETETEPKIESAQEIVPETTAEPEQKVEPMQKPTTEPEQDSKPAPVPTTEPTQKVDPIPVVFSAPAPKSECPAQPEPTKKNSSEYYINIAPIEY
ncbi:MAG: LicD family protein [Schwartzia sp.]|nr:LicD family protein [Schwartzia sp. (in: firmicutes)]